MSHDPYADPVRHARASGFFYLLIIACGVWSEGFARGSLVVPGDAAATAANIAAAPALLRMSFAADTVMALSDVAVGILLFVLLAPVNRTLALVATAMRLTQAAVLTMNLNDQNTALMLLTGATELDSGLAAQFALLLMNAQSHGYDLGLVFFGVNCVLTGLLVVRSKFLPRWLGYALVAAGFVYLAGSGLRFLAPDLHSGFQGAYAVPVLAETAFALWLIVRGVDANAWRKA